MFDKSVYVKRREELKRNMGSGLLVFLGNDESPMNYPGNPYPFRQDSTFLYYFGLQDPGLEAIIDLDSGEEILFGYDYTVDDIVWMGPQPTLQERAEMVGVARGLPDEQMGDVVWEAIRKGRKVHVLPTYRPEHEIKLVKLLGVTPDYQSLYVSEEFIRAVVAQRSVKSPEEIAEIEKALDITREVHLYAMHETRPGRYEREIAGAIEGIARARGGRLSFPIIFSVHGETLHNHHHHNLMKEGDMVVNDCGGETAEGYAGDITRTLPVSGRFTTRQREIYEIVLRSQLAAIEAIRPGVKYRDVHLLTARVIADGLKELGLMKGDMAEAVAQGAHALFFPHGLGHMMGLDVHDMENLGEDYVGYDAETRRSEQFGLAYLRLAKALQPGYVLTVEPGIYFIPELIDQWKSAKKFTDFIDYDKVEEYRDFGGIRIEDDVLVTDTGHRVLGEPIPKTVEEVEKEMAG
jgi:Xaa-Pro aminopeptidase